MRSVGIKVLKNKLSAYVKRAAKGETIQVTDHGRVVAELVPPRPARRNETDEEFFARGAREGWITRAANPKGPIPRGKRVPGLTFEKLMKGLAEDREDRW